MKMERSTRQGSLFLWATMAALLSQNLVIPAIASAALNDQKNYYSPDPNIGTPSTPTGSHHGSGGHHGGSSSHHGGGSSNCGNPPSGGHHGGGHGGYYNPPATPSTPTYTPTPTTPDTPGYTPTPTTPDTPTPTTPIVDSPPTPIVPSPPFGLEPSTPPFGFDPNSPPFTCDYWKSHPGLIWGLVGFWGTVGGAFGVASTPGIGINMNLLQALSNTRNDGLGELYREGTASLLNSMVSKRFPYTTEQVRDSFGAALSSNTAAAAQARLFKLANEGRLKPRV